MFGFMFSMGLLLWFLNSSSIKSFIKDQDDWRRISSTCLFSASNCFNLVYDRLWKEGYIFPVPLKAHLEKSSIRLVAWSRNCNPVILKRREKCSATCQQCSWVFLFISYLFVVLIYQLYLKVGFQALFLNRGTKEILHPQLWAHWMLLFVVNVKIVLSVFSSENIRIVVILLLCTFQKMHWTGELISQKHS